LPNPKAIVPLRPPGRPTYEWLAGPSAIGTPTTRLQKKPASKSLQRDRETGKVETDGEEEETSGEVDWQQEGIGGDRSGVAAQLGGLMDVGENVRGERAGW